jgi:hypothetical protein
MRIFVYFSLIFASPAQASHLAEPTRASLPRNSVCPAEPDVVTLSSSDTKEVLGLLFPSLTHNPASCISEPSSSSDCDQFEDWPEANDTAARVYVALIVDVSRSHTSTVNAPHSDQESRADSSSTRLSRSWSTS